MTPDRDLPPAWSAEIWFRVRHLFVLKVIGTSVFTWIFFVGYFYLLRHPASPPTVMPLTVLDHLIPLQPPMLVAYLSLWLYVGVAPGLQRNFVELVMYGGWVSAMCAAGLLLFYLFPTQIPSTGLAPTDFPGFALMQGVDAAGNACPSMHVAVAAFTALWVEQIFLETGTPAWLRLANFLWFAAIVYSTLAVKQHVALDAVAGIVLGLAFAIPSLMWRPARKSSAQLAVSTDIIKRPRAS